MHEDLIDEALNQLEGTKHQETIIDFHVTACGDDLELIMTHRLPMEEMEYTTLPEVMKKLEGRWEELPKTK
jgi:fructose 1,6-bisphosphatase